MIMKEGKKNGNTLNMQNIIDDETEKKNWYEDEIDKKNWYIFLWLCSLRNE